MKKHLVVLAVCVSLISGAGSVFAKSAVTPATKVAIKKYKTGNYTGCLQDCQNIVKNNPSNSMAYYYMAMAYVQAGQKNNALTYYSKVLSMSSNVVLKQYASIGKKCLETPDQCTTGVDNHSDLDIFVANTSKKLSDSVKQGIEIRNLDVVKDQMNAGQDINPYEFKKFKDFSKNRSKIETDNKIAQKPTNDEIVAALKVLKDAGLNPYYQNTPITEAVIKPNEEKNSATVKITEETANYKNPDVNALNMLMGQNNTSSNNNSMMNMLPALAAQNKDGTSNYSPQLMQAVIMSSMMNNLNFNLDDDK